MVPDTRLRLAAVLKALDDVITPAISKESGVAQEQLSLIKKSIALVREQIPYEFGFIVRDALDFQGLAQALAVQFPAGDAVRVSLEAAVARGAGSVPDIVPDRPALEGHVLALRYEIDRAVEMASAGADGARRARIADIVIRHSEHQTLRERVWVAETGFDRNIAELPSKAEAIFGKAYTP